MSLPGGCPDGCAQERRLELVPAAELDELTALTERADIHTRALAAAVVPLAAAPRQHDDAAQLAATARDTLAAHAPGESRLRELAAQPLEPVVSWWCPHCGGIDAPQPCLGVCIRTPVRWASAEHAAKMQARAAATVKRADALRAVLTLVAHAHPQPGQEQRHWDAMQRRARRALGR
jgi:hypothetical protein